MKGLITQDLFWLTKQKSLMMITGFLLVLYVGINMIEFALAFVPVFLLMVLVRTIIFDLSAGVSRFLFTLPFTRKQYVIEKYLIALLPTSLIAILLGVIGWFSKGQNQTLLFTTEVTLLLLVVMASLFIPFTIRFKEKGALMMAAFATCIILIVVWATPSIGEDWQISPSMLEWLAIPAAVMLILVAAGSCLFISAFISAQLIKNVEF